MSLTQINKAGLDEIALDHVFTIGASGSSAYTFQGEGLNGTVNNPTLYLTRGKTYRFENGTGAHAIRIQSADNGVNGTLYNTGVTNNNTTGTVIVEVQHDAPDILYYQCASHASMKGILYITGALADGGVTTAKLADDAVTAAKIADGTITSTQIAAGTIGEGRIADANITTAKIADDAVTNAKIADNAVAGSNIQTSAVGTTKLAGSAVNSSKILDGAVTTAKIAASAVSTAKIAASAVTATELADQAVTLAKLEHGTSSNDGKFLRANNGADPSFETVTSTTINSNANNRVITGTDTANTLDAEGNLTFTGDVLQVSSTTQGLGARFINTGNEYTQLRFSAARTAARNALGIIEAKWNNNHSVASIYLQTGDDTTNKDDGVITFFTAESGGSQQASMVIHPNGNVTNARQAAMSFNNATNRNDMGTSYNNDPINFGTTHVNKGGMAASNSMSRMTVPTAGVYLCTGMIAGSGDGSNPGDGMQLNLYRNGSVYPEDQAFPITSTSGSSGEEWSIEFSVLASASANDYFEVAMSNIDTNNYVTTERGNFQVTLLH